MGLIWPPGLPGASVVQERQTMSQPEIDLSVTVLSVAQVEPHLAIHHANADG